jgi:hypothetical protein
MSRPKVFFDIEIGGKKAGRIIFEVKSFKGKKKNSYYIYKKYQN